MKINVVGGIICATILVFIGVLVGRMTSETTPSVERHLRETNNTNENESFVQKSKNSRPVNLIELKEIDGGLGNYAKIDNGTEAKLAISHKDLLKATGATKALKWQEKYDLGIYNPIYDQTWQDDMYNRAYELALGEEFSNDIEMTHIECQDNNCNLEIRQLASSKKSGSRLASEFILSLKDHPAILESGKKRNVYIETIQLVDGKHKVIANIY